ncbi:MAG: radical SAM protein [Candidatus Sedimenticola sp. (ex Thyasira tokunagai)]
MTKIYEKVKIRAHKQLLAAVSSQEKTIPLHVRIEPTEICNLRCSFCWWHNPQRRSTFNNLSLSGREKLVTDRFLTLVDELKAIGVQALSFTGAGDPLCHNGMEAVLGRVVDSELFWGITSNMGMPLSEQMIELLARAQWVRWSLNAGSSKGYREINRPRTKADKTFSLACENISRLHERRQQLDNPCTLTASYILHNNSKDIVSAAELASTLGADAIAYRPDTPVTRQETPSQFESSERDAMVEAKHRFDSEHFTVDIGDVRLGDVAPFPPNILCYYSNHSTYIDARGDIYPCCYTRFDAKYVIGNIMEQPFETLWWSKQRLDNYRQLSMRYCPSCPHGRTNQILKDYYDGKIHIEKEEEGVLSESDYFI